MKTDCYETRVIYSSDYTSLNAAMNALDVDNEYGEGSAKRADLCNVFTVKENNNHSICVITCFGRYYTKFIEPLLDDNKIELLGCEDGCNHAKREKPSECLTSDDWDKVALAWPECNRTCLPGELS